MNKIDAFIVGEKIETTLVLDTAEIRETNTNPPREYMNATFVAGKKSINAKMWDVPPRFKLPVTKAKYDVKATVGEYLGKKQLTLSDFQMSLDQSMTEFMPAVDVPLPLLRSTLFSTISWIKDDKLKEIVTHVYEGYEADLMASTSAKGVHHVGVGGNIQHTIEVVQTAIAIVDANPQWTINRDLVIAGALLHDIGKAFIYDMSTPVMDYTPIGHLLEHITYAIILLERLLVELDDTYESRIRLLQHIVASHHGKKEFGSPVTPIFMEAYIVNYADQISATLDAIHEANKEATDELLTSKIWVGGNRQHFLQDAISDLLTGEKDSL